MPRNNRNNRNRNQSGQARTTGQAGTTGEAGTTIQVINPRTNSVFTVNNVPSHLRGEALARYCLSVLMSEEEEEKKLDNDLISNISTYIFHKIITNDEMVETIRKGFREMEWLEMTEESRAEVKMAQVIFNIMVAFKDDKENYFKMCNEWNESKKHRLPYYQALWHSTITLDLERSMESLFDRKDIISDQKYLVTSNLYGHVKKLRDFIEENYDVKVVYGE